MEKGILNYGVPQGSIFGPILFLLHVNDMKTALKNCHFRLYPDDTSILYSHQNVKFIEINLNYDINNLCEWFIDNKLSLHIYILGKIKLKAFYSKEETNLISH